MRYTKLYISNSVSNTLSQGWSTPDVLDLFLSMKMTNDLPEDDFSKKESLSPNNVRMNLIGNGVIDQKDFRIEYLNNKYRTPRLIVELSPSCRLYVELVYGTLKVTVNDKNYASISIKHISNADVALWMINQKTALSHYMSEWEEVLKKSAKKTKSNRLALLAIKAIFTEAMKDYPELQYIFIEQKRRVRIRVKLPNCNLGVFIDGWWGSYKQRLPEQIDDLKFLIEAHSKTHIKDFFVAKH